MHILALLTILVAQGFGSLPVDGIRCEQSEGAVEHIHAQLQLYDKGQAVKIPANIGISQSAGCLYWMHTHTDDGYIHIESPVKQAFTLGEFFDLWAMELSWKHAATMQAPPGKMLSIWVNGKKWTGKDPRTLVLADRETIVIQNGPPFAKPSAADWSKL
jgi:hypothetical protein